MTSTVPEAWAGLVTTIWVPVLLVDTIIPGTPPKFTADAQSRLTPVIVTLVPPALGPLLGETDATEGTTPG
jgi:hypothetical protein